MRKKVWIYPVLKSHKILIFLEKRTLVEIDMSLIAKNRFYAMYVIFISYLDCGFVFWHHDTFFPE